MADGSRAPLAARLIIPVCAVLGYLLARHVRITLNLNTYLAAALFSAAGTVGGFLIGLNLAQWIMRGNKNGKK